MTVSIADLFTLAVGGWTETSPDQEVGQFSTVQLTYNVDGGVDLAFSLPGTSPGARALSELDTDCWLYRGSSTPDSRLRIVGVNQTWDADGNDTVNVAAVDYKRLLNARHFMADQNYDDVGQADLIWQVIQHTQAQPGGDLGITAGTLDNNGQLRDRTWVAGENIGKELADLSGVENGPWWEIDGGLVLNVGTYDGFPTRDAPIELGSTARTLTRASSAATFGNAVWVDGDSGATTPVQVDAADILTDPRGRWERVAGYPNVVIQATLNDKADGLLLAAQSPAAVWTAEIEPRRYLTDAAVSIGEFVEIVVPPTVAAPIVSPGFSVAGQILSVTVTVDADGSLAVSTQIVEVPS